MKLVSSRGWWAREWLREAVVAMFDALTPCRLHAASEVNLVAWLVASNQSVQVPRSRRKAVVVGEGGDVPP